MAARVPDPTQTTGIIKALERKGSASKLDRVRQFLNRTNSSPQYSHSSPSFPSFNLRSHSAESDMMEMNKKYKDLFLEYFRLNDFRGFGDTLVKLFSHPNQREEVIQSLVGLRQRLEPGKVEMLADSVLHFAKETKEQDLLLFFHHILIHLSSHDPTGLDLLYEYVIKHPQDHETIAKLMASNVGLEYIANTLLHFDKKNSNSNATEFISLLGTYAIENELESSFRDYYSGRADAKKWADEISAFCKRAVLNRYCMSALCNIKRKIEGAQGEITGQKGKGPLSFFFECIDQYVEECSDWSFLLTPKHDFSNSPLVEQMVSCFCLKQLFKILSEVTQLELNQPDTGNCLREDCLSVTLGSKIARHFLIGDLMQVKDALDKKLKEVDLKELCVKAGLLFPGQDIHSKEISQKIDQNLVRLRSFVKSWLVDFYHLDYSDEFYELIRCRSQRNFGSKQHLKNELISKFWLFEIVIPFLIKSTTIDIYSSILLDIVKSMKFVAIPPNESKTSELSFKVFAQENRAELEDIIALHQQMLEKFGCKSS